MTQKNEERNGFNLNDFVLYQPKKPSLFNSQLIGQKAKIVKTSDVIMGEYYIRFDDGLEFIVDEADIHIFPDFVTPCSESEEQARLWRAACRAARASKTGQHSESSRETDAKRAPPPPQSDATLSDLSDNALLAMREELKSQFMAVMLEVKRRGID